MDKFEEVYKHVLADLEEQQETHDALLQEREEKDKTRESNRLDGRWDEQLGSELETLDYYEIPKSEHRKRHLEDLKDVFESIKHMRDEAAEQGAAAAPTPAEARKRKCSGAQT